MKAYKQGKLEHADVRGAVLYSQEELEELAREGEDKLADALDEFEVDDRMRLDRCVQYSTKRERASLLQGLCRRNGVPVPSNMRGSVEELERALRERSATWAAARRVDGSLQGLDQRHKAQQALAKADLDACEDESDDSGTSQVATTIFTAAWADLTAGA